MENEELVEETIVNDNTQNVTEEEQQIETETAYSDLTVEDYNRLAKEKAELERKNKQLFERIKKQQGLKPLQTSANPDEGWKEKMELKVEGYTDDEIAFIQKNGGRKALDNPFVKTAVDSIRNQRLAEGAVVDSDATKSDIEKKYTSEQLSQMSSSELEKLLPRA